MDVRVFMIHQIISVSEMNQRITGFITEKTESRQWHESMDTI